MLKVKVYPDTDPTHMKKIYAGLSDLDEEDKIQLRFLKRCPPQIKNTHEWDLQTLWVEVEDLDNKKTCKLCLDMEDNRKINAMTRLKECDVYFKRSYHQPYINTFTPDLQKKIFPYGLNYACRSPFEKGILQRLLVYYYARNLFFKNPVKAIGHISRQAGKYILPNFLSENFNLDSLVQDFEATPDVPTESKILFQTRVWQPASSVGGEVKKITELNDIRANTVRALRKAFGKQFVGGLVHTDLAREYYSDCLADESTDQNSFLKLVKSCLITVTSTGLHDSIGWKVPEYLAASRCIVTEPLENKLPVPLEEYKNYISFRTPQECVEVCKKLLDNPELARQMRINNYSYYLNEVKPSVHLYKCLKVALSNKAA